MEFSRAGLISWTECSITTRLSALNVMARENPELRASAAQMLVKCFNGQGLSIPRHQISPIPDQRGVLEESQTSRQPGLTPKVMDLRQEVMNSSPGVIERAKYAPTTLLANQRTPQRDLHPKEVAEIERREELSAMRMFS